MSEVSEFVCYIRRNDGNGWVRSRSHHRQALESFLYTPVRNINEGVYISVPHGDGGDFVATFRRVNIEDIADLQNVQNMANYTDEFGRIVEIIMAKSNYIAYVNRLTS